MPDEPEATQEGNASTDTNSVQETTPPTPVQNSSPPPRHGGEIDLSSLSNEIAALPERIANAVREAVTPPKPPKPKAEPKEETKSESDEKPKEDQTKVPGDREHKLGSSSFGEWWFGR